PRSGVMAIFTCDSAGGYMARRVLPAAVGVLSLLGWLRLEGERLAYYDTAAGVALMVVATLVIFAALIAWNARALERVEDERARRAGPRDPYGRARAGERDTRLAAARGRGGRGASRAAPRTRLRVLHGGAAQRAWPNAGRDHVRVRGVGSPLRPRRPGPREGAGARRGAGRRQGASLRGRGARPSGSRGGQPRQGRVPGDRVARVENTALPDPRVVPDASPGDPRRGEDAARAGGHRALRTLPGAARRGPARCLPHHHREASPGGATGPPGSGGPGSRGGRPAGRRGEGARAAGGARLRGRRGDGRPRASQAGGVEP